MATHPQRHEGFEERTYKAAAGAETPGHATVQGLHLHEAHGQEEAGAPLSGRTAPWGSSGGTAPTSKEDRPVKIQSHKYTSKDAEETTDAPSPAATASTTTTEVPAALEDIAHEEEPPSAKGGVGAAAGMCAHGKDFEATMAEEAKGAETPDGQLQALHLHAAHGEEGPGSRADRQLGALVEDMRAHPEAHAAAAHHGAHATPSDQDPPDKMMTHQREEAGAGGIKARPLTEPAGAPEGDVAAAGDQPGVA